MMRRCYNEKDPSFKWYGFRGIGVCIAWREFLCFKEWADRTYTAGLTLERKNNSLGYSPRNCTWATASEQAINRRVNPIKTKHMQAAAYVARNKKHGDPVTRKNKRCSACLKTKGVDLFYKKLNTKGQSIAIGWCKLCTIAAAA